MRPLPSEQDDYLPISALRHLVYCERQAMLIVLEGFWMDDEATVEGKLLHERADLPGSDVRRGVRVARAVPLRSDRLRLVGRADVVEFHPDREGSQWRPMPVEYKRGRVKNLLADQVQLCAQALCLEEMLETWIPRGMLFYAESHRRIQVDLDANLRHATEEATRRLHELVERQLVPPPEPGPKCRRCSFLTECQPEALADRRRARTYLLRLTRPEEDL